VAILFFAPSRCDLLDSLPTDDTIVAALRQRESETFASPDVPSAGTIAPTILSRREFE
jgi:hypothetical protein